MRTEEDNMDNTIFQVSLLQALVLGHYYGAITAGELKRHGACGLGTFEGLNGELVLLDGEVLRAAGDGRIEAVGDAETVPFATAAFLDPAVRRPVPGFESFEALQARVDGEADPNRPYLVRLDGRFDRIRVRSVRAQREPYLPMPTVMERDQTFFEYEDIAGTLVGFRFPAYMGALNAAGWHLHFLSDDRRAGGHVLELAMSEGTLTLCPKDEMHVRLPQTAAFSGLDLAADLTEAVEKVEKGR